MAVKLAPGFIGTRPNCFQFLGEIHIFLILTGTPCQKSPVLHVKPHYQGIHRENELSIMMSEIIENTKKTRCTVCIIATAQALETTGR